MSWEGIRFVSISNGRSPAAIKGLRDLSSLRGTSLSTAAESQFMSQSLIEKTKEGLEIALNQFVMRDSQGKRNFVCQVEGRPGVFDRVEVTLIGLGISEGGKLPKLTIETDCKSQPNPKFIGPIKIFIPMAKIYELRPVDQDLNFYDEQNSFIRISQMPSEWPGEWSLESIRYFNSKSPQEMLTLLTPEKKSPSKGAFTLKWTEPAPQKF